MATIKSFTEDGCSLANRRRSLKLYKRWLSRPIRPYVRSNSFLSTRLLSGEGVASEKWPQRPPFRQSQLSTRLRGEIEEAICLKDCFSRCIC